MLCNIYIQTAINLKYKVHTIGECNIFKPCLILLKENICIGPDTSGIFVWIVNEAQDGTKKASKIFSHFYASHNKIPFQTYK